MNPQLSSVLVLVAGTIPFVAAADPAARETVLAADTAFAALSVERGAQQAFQAYLASDGVVFRPTAVAGGEWFATHEQASGRLEWNPAAAVVEPAKRRTEPGPKAVYVRVWMHDGRAWRLALDMSTPLVE